MKESNTLADNVAIRQLQLAALLSIKEQCMKELNTLAYIVVITQLQLGALLSIKELCMKESNTLVEYATISIYFKAIYYSA